MLYNTLLVFLVIDAVVLTAAILLQSGKGGGLAANFGGASSSPDAFVGIRQAGTILTKATWYCGGIFLALAFVLQIMSTRATAPRSILEDTFGTPAPASAPATSEAAAPTGSAVPLEPIPGTTGPVVPQPSPTPALPNAAPPAPVTLPPANR